LLATASIAAGYTDPKKPKYELNFDQFLDALAAIAIAKYPAMDAESAVREVLATHLRPLFINRFGEAPPAGDGSQEGADDDGGTVVTSRTTGTTTKTQSRRKSRVVLTSEGIAAASAAVSGPKVAVVVDQTMETAVLSGATVMNPGASTGSSVIGGGGGQPAIVKRRLSMRLGGGNALGDGGSDVGSRSPSGSRRASSAPRSGRASVAVSPAAAGVGGSPVSSSPAGPYASSGGKGLGPARNVVPSMYSVNPFSPEARGAPLATEAFVPSSASPAAPAAGSGVTPMPMLPSSARLGGGASAVGSVSASPVGSPSGGAETAAEMKAMIRSLLGVVDQMRGELVKAKAENSQLRAQVDLLKAQRGGAGVDVGSGGGYSHYPI
jgi:hypothetical protein